MILAGGTGWGDGEQLAAQATNVHHSHGSVGLACMWSAPSNATYLKGCADGGPDRLPAAASATPRTAAQLQGACTPGFATLDEAKTSCVSSKWADCTGVTYQAGIYQLRSGSSLLPNPPGKWSTSWTIAYPEQCKGHISPAPGPLPAIDPVRIAILMPFILIFPLKMQKEWRIAAEK